MAYGDLNENVRFGNTPEYLTPATISADGQEGWLEKDIITGPGTVCFGYTITFEIMERH